MLAPQEAQAVGLAQLPPCQTAGQACVVVRVLDADGQQVGGLTYTTADELTGPEADVIGQDYAAPGRQPTTVPKGTSVGALLATAGVDPSQIGFVEVDGTDGYGRHLLTSAELQGGAQRSSPPVFYPSPAGSGDSATDSLYFIRTARGGDDDPFDSSPDLGFLHSDDDASLELVVHLGVQPLAVTATATPVAAGSRTFALTSTPTAGDGRTTTWVFPDSTTSNDPTPTYTVPGGFAGSVPIAVAVQGADGALGWATATVQVGSVPTATASPSAATGTGGHGQGHTGSGHGHQGGGHGPSGHGSTGPSSGPTSGPSTGPSATPTSTPTSGPTGGSTSGPGSVPSYRPPAQGLSAAPTRLPRPSPSPTAIATPPPVGDPVAGVLLAADQVVTPSTPSPSAAPLTVRADVPRAQAAAPLPAPPLRVPWWAWLAGAAAVLLGLGATSESEGARLRLRRWLKMGS